MTARRSAALLDALALVAPGSPLRDGLDRILQAGMGALIVVGDGPEVLNICSGGFLLDAAYSPQRLSELAKMDGATILAADASRIARANVHLVPNPNVPTSETGTRHRTAERVARSIKVPVISVSQRMNVISVYAGDEKHEIEPVPRVVNRANQAVQTLERYKTRLDEVSLGLATLEIEDLVTAARRGERAPAHRDGRPHRRGDRGLHHRARRRRPARPPAARGAARRARATSGASWCGTTSTRSPTWHLPDALDALAAALERRPARAAPGRRHPPPRGRLGRPRRVDLAPRLPAAVAASRACPTR